MSVDARPPRGPSALPTLLAAFGLLVLTGLVYLPGLGGPFIGDDEANFLLDPSVRVASLDVDSLLAAATANESGPGGRMLAALSFGLDYHFAGQRFEPAAFKRTNLVIHLLNTLLVGWLAFRLLAAGGLRDDPWLRVAALFAAALWAVHPLQLTNVLYVVQRMNSLATLGVLAGLLVWLNGRERLRAGRPGGTRRMAAGLVAGMGLGLLGKETSLVLPVLVLAVEVTLFRGAAATASARRTVMAFHALATGAAGLAGLALFVVAFDGFASGFALRELTATERLMTQPRVLWWYLGQWFAPDLAALSLHHDDWRPSRGLFSPVTTAASLAAGALVLASTAALLRVTPWPAFGAAFFIAGHALESGPLPLELVFEHRNYVPTIGLAVAMAGLALQAFAWRGRSTLVATVGSVILVGLMALSTWGRATVWGDAARLIVTTAENKPLSIRAQSDLAHLMHATGMPADQVYAAHARVEALGPRNAVVQIAMLELLGRMQAGPATASTLDAATAAGERSRLVDVVTAHFGSPRLTVADVESARRVTDCIEREPAACASMAPAVRRWVAAALANGALDPGVRRALLWMRARLEARDGLAEQALATLDEAIADARRTGAVEALALRRQRVALLITFGRADEARVQLRALEAIGGNARHRQEIARLRIAVDRL